MPVGAGRKKYPFMYRRRPPSRRDAPVGGADKAREEFLAGISHDLRTPLNGVLGMLQLLEESGLTPKQKELLEAAARSGRLLAEIIGDSLDFSLLQTEHTVLENEPFNLRASIHATLLPFRDQALANGLSFTVSLDSDLPAKVRGDEVRLGRIISALADNAVRFTRRGGISISCSLDHMAMPENGKCVIHLKVTDTGSGIHPDKLDEILKTFERTDGVFPKNTGKPGAGLGLYIARRLALMMGGDISLKSEAGRGTSVSCSLRLGTQEGLSPLRPRPLDILVAEDDEVGRFTLQAFLRRSGHNVVCVNDGIQALEALQLHSFDCLLTDIRMPRLDGLELARRVRNGESDGVEPTEEVREMVLKTFALVAENPLPLDPGIAIVAVSANAMARDLENLLRSGIDHYLAKPVDSHKLVEVLNHVLSDCL